MPTGHGDTTRADGRVLLLRAVNVGGRNRLPMAQLRTLLDGLGCSDVTTYLQSGNAVCRSTTPAEELGSEVAVALEEQLGLGVAVLARSAAQLSAIVAANPLRDLDEDPKRLHVTFLDGTPDQGRLDALVAESAGFAPERLVASGSELYLHIPAGYHDAKLTGAFLERRLGLATTTRNWRTVLALADLVGATG